MHVDLDGLSNSASEILILRTKQRSVRYLENPVNNTVKQLSVAVTKLLTVTCCFAFYRSGPITSRFTSYAGSVLTFVSILLSTIAICYADTSCGVVAGGGFEKTVDVVEQVEAKPKCVQTTGGMTSLCQRKPEVGLACLAETEDPESSAMGPKQMATSEGLAGLSSQGDLALPKKKDGTDVWWLCLRDFAPKSPGDSCFQVDADQGHAQSVDWQLRPGNPRALVVEHRSGIHWGSLITQWWSDIAFEQTERLIMEPKTRDQLGGKFFHEWFSDVVQYRYGLWNDGDKFFTSYIGHPLQGAVVEGIFWQNDDRVRFSEQDFHSAAYRKALLQAFAFAAVDAVQWKLGPVSEATIGHVGLPAHWWSTPYFCNLAHAYCHPRTGLNDLVMNEVGGTAMTIGFQWVDKHFQRPMENRINSRALINTMRIFTNPPQSLANFFRFRTPWYRDNRD